LFEEWDNTIIRDFFEEWDNIIIRNFFEEWDNIIIRDVWWIFFPKAVFRTLLICVRD
jgi:hypothetical protein